MKTLKVLGAGIAMVGLLSITSAKASIVAVGPTIAGNSWAQEFVLTDTSFDSFAVTWVSGTVFEQPAIRKLSTDSGLTTAAPGWAAITGTSTSDSASGSARTSLYFTMNWIGSASGNPTVFNLYDYNGSTLIGSAQAAWTGSKWNIGAVPVPESSTVIAAGLLLLPLGASTLRILRRKHMA